MDDAAGLQGSTPSSTPSKKRPSSEQVPALAVPTTNGSGGSNLNNNTTTGSVGASLQQHISLLELKRALINFTVFLLGGVFLLVGYLNVVLVRPYLPAVFWACAAAIPLHSMKNQVLNFLVDTFYYQNASVLGFVWSVVKVLSKLLLGPLWAPLVYLSRGYFTTVTRISRRDQVATATSLRKRAESLTPPTIVAQGPDGETKPLLAPSLSRRSSTTASELEETSRKQPSVSDLNNLDDSSEDESHSPPTFRFAFPGSEGGSGSEGTVFSSNKKARTELSVKEGTDLTDSSPRVRFPSKLRRRTLRSHSTTAADNNSNHNHLHFEDAAEDSHRRAISVSDKILESLAKPKNASSAYLGYLFRSCAIYVIYLLLVNMDWDTAVALAYGFVVLIALHLTFHFLFWLWHQSVANVSPDGHGAYRRTMEWLNSLRIVRLLWRRGVVGLHRLYTNSWKRTRASMKTWIYQNLNALVTLMLIAGVVTAALGMTGFLAFKIVQEANALADVTYNHINNTLATSQSDPQFQQQVESALVHVRAYVSNWTDEKLAETFPGSNVTFNDLYSRAYETYQFVKNHNQPSPTISLEAAAGGVQSPIASPWIYLPKTRKLLHVLFAGGTYELSTRELTGESFQEMQTFAVQFGSDLRSRFPQRKGANPNVAQYLSDGATWLLKYGGYLLVASVNGFTYAFTVMVDYLIFFACLYYLVLNAHSPMHYLSQVLIAVDPKHRIRTSVERSIQAIILSTMKITVFHALLTWITFSLVGLEYVYFASLLSGAMAAIPVVSPFMVTIPAIVQLLLLQSYWSTAFILVTHLWAILVVDAAIYGEIPETHSFVASYSVLLGLWAFGVEGLLLGPILACVPVILYHVVADMMQDA